MTYQASIKVHGKRFDAVGETVLEAISNLKPGIAKGLSVIVLKKDKEQQDRILTATATMKLFNRSPLMREIALKNTANLFNL